MNKDWTLIIKPHEKIWHVDFKEIWRYRDLVSLFVKRNIIVQYKQTVLGPLWYIIQPILTVIMNIDGLSSNAGVTVAITPIKFISQENANTIFNTNYFSHIFLAKMFFKKKLNIGASIVFTASIGGISAFVTGSALYGSSKAALNSFTKFCAVEFASRKIRCNSVCPGMINTPMTKPGDFVTEDDYKKDVKSYLVGRYGEPEEIARTILFLLSDASSFITGASIIADGGSSIPH